MISEPRFPRDDEIAGALLERRVLVVNGLLDVTRSSSLCALLLTMDATGDEPIELRLANCWGPLDSALTIHDVMSEVGVEIHVDGLGLVQGGPVLLLASGSRRRVARHASIRLLEEEIAVSGTARDLERTLAAHAQARDNFLSLLAKRCGRPLAEIESEWTRATSLDADDAVALGYADSLLPDHTASR